MDTRIDCLTIPPVGSLLFIGCSVADIGIEKVIKPLIPMFAVMIVVLVIDLIGFYFTIYHLQGF